MNRLPARELARKCLHMAVGLFALALSCLNWWQASLCALAALFHNLFILPRTSRFALRNGRLDSGLIAYPVSVLGLILLYPDRLELAGAAWAFMAFGDGMATIVGKIIPLVRFRWAGGKSLGGFGGFFLFGSLSSYMMYAQVGGTAGPIWIFLLTGFLVGLSELIPAPLNDNITVPFLSVFILGLLIDLHPGSLPGYPVLLTALGVNIVLALLALVFRLVSVSALAGGILVGTLILYMGGLPAYALLLGFFLMATAATFTGIRKKEKDGTAQEMGGRRGSRHALANCTTAVFLSCLVPFSSDFPAVKLALAAALATALADTLGSEIGQLAGKTPVDPVRLRRVPVGTEGAISAEGILAGVIGASLLAGVPLVWGWYPPAGIPIVTLAALTGSVAESYLARIGEWDNEILNFFNTLIGAGLAFLLAGLFL